MHTSTPDVTRDFRRVYCRAMLAPCPVSRSRRIVPRLARLVALAAALCAGAPALAGADEAPRFEWSGTQRTRYEAQDSQFRAGFDDADRALALQTSLAFTVRTTPHTQLFAEIMDARAELDDEHSAVNGGIVDALEPLQLNFAWTKRDVFESGAESTLRVGRMTPDVGKRRLVARNRFRNVPNNFTGVDWQWHDAAGRSARAFYLRPMRSLPADLDGVLGNDVELDRGLRGARLLGLYYQWPAFADKSVLEVYALDYRLRPAAGQLATAVDVLTPGARVYRPAAARRWNYEVETILQRGTSGGVVGGVARADLAHRASFVHAEVGYQFAPKSAPVLVLQYDRASGDRDPNDARVERFNTLFGARRSDFGPTDIFGPFARSNLVSPGVRLTLKPAPRWQTMFAYRAFALDEPRDQWVGSGWRDASGRAGDSLGRQLEATFTWAAIKDRLAVETGFAQLWLGAFPERVEGPALRGDPTFFYAAITTSF
jgi:hypothetical protein